MKRRGVQLYYIRFIHEVASALNVPKTNAKRVITPNTTLQSDHVTGIDIDELAKMALLETSVVTLQDHHGRHQPQLPLPCYFEFYSKISGL